MQGPKAVYNQCSPALTPQGRGHPVVQMSEVHWVPGCQHPASLGPRDWLHRAPASLGGFTVWDWKGAPRTDDFDMQCVLRTRRAQQLWQLRGRTLHSGWEEKGARKLFPGDQEWNYILEEASWIDLEHSRLSTKQGGKDSPGADGEGVQAPSQSGYSAPLWVRSQSFWILMIFKDVSHEDSSWNYLHHRQCQCACELAANMQPHSIFGCQTGKLLAGAAQGEAGWTVHRPGTGPTGQVEFPRRHWEEGRVLSREVPGQDSSFSKITVGTEEGQIQGGEGGGRGSALEAQPPRRGRGDFPYQVAVPCKPPAPHNPPFPKLN